MFVMCDSDFDVADGSDCLHDTLYTYHVDIQIHLRRPISDTICSQDGLRSNIFDVDGSVTIEYFV